MNFKFIAINCLLSLSFLTLFGQSQLQIVDIGNFKTVSNETINNCKIGYRTLGELNKDKNNVVVMPTWFLGTSEDNLEYLQSIIDAKGLYLITIDALGNGNSSSPSNYPNFPAITIRDMVNSQHELLVNYLKIDHVNLLIGVSMGGMQAFEWMVAFPKFMDQLIAINGTTQASFYDKAVWQTMISLIENAGDSKEELSRAMNRVKDVSFITSTSPSYVTKKYESENFNEFRSKMYDQESYPFNRLSQAKAILDHSIYTTGNVNLENIKELVKAEVFIIVAEQDHLVNPIYSRELSKILNCKLFELTGDCGHIAAFCDEDLVKKAIADFLHR